MDAFTRALGSDQGRVEGVGFVLGHLTPGQDANLVPGDFAEIVQQADLTGVDVVRVRGHLDVRAGRWVFSVRVDGQTLGRLEGRSRPVTDLGADVRALVGVHEVAVRLEYAAP